VNWNCYRADPQDLTCLGMLNDLARIDRRRTVHLVGACVIEGGPAVRAPAGSVISRVRRTERPAIDEEAQIATSVVDPWPPGQQVQLFPDLVLEAEIAEMAADRPWGPVANRLEALHKAVTGYTLGSPRTRSVAPSRTSPSRAPSRGSRVAAPSLTERPDLPRGAVVFGRRQRAGWLRDDSDRGAR
jgi:hypothetical protein